MVQDCTQQQLLETAVHNSDAGNSDSASFVLRLGETSSETTHHHQEMTSHLKSALGIWMRSVINMIRAVSRVVWQVKNDVTCHIT